MDNEGEKTRFFYTVEDEDVLWGMTANGYGECDPLNENSFARYKPAPLLSGTSPEVTQPRSKTVRSCHWLDAGQFKGSH